MSKNIVLFSDGTGNSAAKLFKTNVWRTYEALDLSAPDQIAFYDDGVGTSSFPALAAVGGAVGWGLKRNVLDLYSYLCEHYEPGDRLFAFGFSRGAFTIRVLVGLVAHQGILRGAQTSELPRLAAWAYRAYRSTYNPTGWLVAPLRLARNAALRARDRLAGHRPYAAIVPHVLKDGEFTFVGLWDTVDAYGLPIDELRDGIDQWVWPLSIPSTEPSRIIGRGCHALALDDERQTFHPVLWDETNEPQDADHIDRERITQVWFAGMHANVGGGYADDRLAHVALEWITDRAAACGLRFLSELKAALSAQADARGRLYDSRAGFGGYYRYNPRTTMVEPDHRRRRAPKRRDKIHESVFERMRSEPAYAPIVLPRGYAVVDGGGRIHDCRDVETEPMGGGRRRRLNAQDACWDLVWWRRVTYFATIGATIALLLRPAGFGPDPRLAPDTGIALRWLAAMLAGFVPSFAAPLTGHFQKYPLELIVGVALVTGLLAAGHQLQRTIAERMRAGWAQADAAPSPATTSAWRAVTRFIVHDGVRALRTSPAYRRVSFLMRRRAIPFLFGMYSLMIVLTIVNRGVFEAVNSVGRFCSSSSSVQAVSTAPQLMAFAPQEFCHPTGLAVTRSKRYRVDVSLPSDDPWRDGPIPVDSVAGIGATSGQLSLAQRLLFAAAAPARRIWRANFFTPVIRAGADGDDHYVLGTPCTTFTAHKDGELFLFVNDAIWPVAPRLAMPPAALGWRAYYPNNLGGPASVTIAEIAMSAAKPEECRADAGTE